jgi:hypothetical protein
MELSEGTQQRIKSLFAEEDRFVVSSWLKMLVTELESDRSAGLERICFAVLKLSQGQLPQLQRAIDLAKQDWRDALVAADFANDIKAHLSWWPGPRRGPGAVS